MSVPSPLWCHSHPLVLASGSAIRARLLQNLGIPILIDPAKIDERAIETLNPLATAAQLAQAKALYVAAQWPDHLVLGADQTLIFENSLIHKPTSRAQAIAQLQRLSGKSHTLISAASLVKNQQVLISVEDTAIIHMRALSQETIETYLDAMGEDVYSTVGGYQLEGLGPHILDYVEGDFATILGLPLWPLMRSLRQAGFILQ